MYRFNQIEINKGLYRVEGVHPQFGAQSIGFISKGNLVEDRHQGLVVRGARWVVLGFEYLTFRNAGDAAEALYRHWRHMTDAHAEDRELRELIGVSYTHQRAAKFSKERSAKKVWQRTRNRLRKVRQDLHASLDHAGISTYIREGGPAYV